MHKHRQKTAREATFGGQVAWPGNPSAHGWITRTATCSCGATRASNHNGNASEYGPWQD